MANVDKATGFRPARHFDGTPFNGSHQLFLIPSGDSTAVFVGDLVKAGGTSGAAGVTVAGMDVEGIQTCALATAGTSGQDLLGVVVGFLPDPTTNLGVTNRYRVASTNRIAMVVTDRSVVYEVQEDADTTPIPQADIGLNVAYTTTAGSTVTGISKMQIDSSTVNTTNTLPIKIIGLVKRPDNALNTGGSLVDNAKFEVLINTGYFMPNIAGV